MEEAFRALLLASGDVTALSGPRVNWGAHPQGQPLPGVVLNLVDDSEPHTLDGPCGLSQGRVQVDSYADTYLAARDLGRAIRSLLDGHRDALFQGIFLAGVQSGRESGETDAERFYRVRQDFLIHYNRN